MGAFAAYLGPEDAPDGAVVQRMAAAVPHRGTRIAILRHGRAALAAIDRDDGRDALVGLARGLAVAVVGRIDNAGSLAAELAGDAIRRGVPPPDPANLPDLLAAAYLLLGPAFPARLRGTFSGAVTDGRWMLAFRDHVGYRPCLYRLEDGRFFAATEAKQVVAGAGIAREPDLAVVEAIFFREYDDETPAALRGVHRLPKASTITAGAGMAADEGAVARYWNPEALLETARISDQELAERFAALMEQAVSRCLTGEDAISLSGGIDSPAVAAFAAPLHAQRFERPLQALSVVYPRHPTVDESRYVRLLADRFAIPLHTFEQHARPTDDLVRWVALADTPFAGAALAQYEEDYGHVRDLGCSTVLTGEHAEYVFALQWYTLDHYLTHGRLRAARRQLAERRGRGASWLSLGRLVLRSVASDHLMAIRNRWSPGLAPPPGWIDRDRATAREHLPARERWRRSQLVGFVGPGISLEAEEVCQDVCGVRSRKPWTDVDLWELFLSLPAEQKFPDLRPKGLVRDLLRGRVPDEILDRQDKTVFDEAAMAQVDYPALRALLVDSPHPISGVDYDRLGEALRREKLSPREYQWARNLANVHAFLSQW